MSPFLRSPDKAARTSIYLCNSEEVSGISGGYFVKCRQREPKPWVRDDAAAERLWDYSEACVGFHYPT